MTINLISKSVSNSKLNGIKILLWEIFILQIKNES
jgi:hypothetical protein